MVKRVFKKELLDLIGVELLKIGLKKKNRIDYYKELNEKILGTVGFGISTYGRKDLICLNPVIGILYKDIGHLMEKTIGFNSFKYFLPTISTPLGYLLPERYYKEWEFEEGKDNTSIITDMVNQISSKGFSFFEGKASLKELIQEVEKGDFILKVTQIYTLPLLYYCNGEKKKGIDFINKNMITEGVRYYNFLGKYKEL